MPYWGYSLSSTYIEIDMKRRSVDHAFARTTDKEINGIKFSFSSSCFFFFNLWNRILFIACMHNLVYYNSKLVFFFENDEKKCVFWNYPSNYYFRF